MFTRHSATLPFFTMHLMSCTQALSILSRELSALAIPPSTASSMLFGEDDVISMTFATVDMASPHLIAEKVLATLSKAPSPWLFHHGMTLNLVKLCVGVSELSELERWIADAAAGRDTLDHVTRMFPKRRDEILKGGSLYWVIRGMILCRQPIVDLEKVVGGDGIERCRIMFAPKIIPVRPVPRRAFQGWRYLEAADSPPDLAKGTGKAGLSDKMRRELAELGLL